MRKAWTALRASLDIRAAEEKKIKKMVDKFKKFHIGQAFKRYRQQAMWEVQLREKDKIEGAYLLLKRFKNRLKNMDSALEKLNEKKSDRSELAILSESVDSNKTVSIFNDMKVLLDTTVQNME